MKTKAFILIACIPLLIYALTMVVTPKPAIDTIFESAEARKFSRQCSGTTKITMKNNQIHMRCEL